MGLADRDYMYQKKKPSSASISRRVSQPTSKPARLGFFTKLLAYSGILVASIAVSHQLQKVSLENWQSIFPSISSPLASPQTGDVILYPLGQQSPALAVFKVIAKGSRNEANHLVKLIDVASDRPVLSLFIRNAEVAVIKVPLGTYKIKIAQGSQWYGDTKLFGKDTRLTEGITPMAFIKTQNGITGHTLTLDANFNGNFPTHPLADGNF